MTTQHEQEVTITHNNGDVVTHMVRYGIPTMAEWSNSFAEAKLGNYQPFCLALDLKIDNQNFEHWPFDVVYAICNELLAFLAEGLPTAEILVI